jgi:hypothetical protein
MSCRKALLYEISAWKRTSKKGTLFLSLAIKLVREPTDQRTAAAPIVDMPPTAESVTIGCHRDRRVIGLWRPIRCSGAL